MTGGGENLTALVLYFLLVVGLVAVILLVSWLIGPSSRKTRLKPGHEKDLDPSQQTNEEPFESGIVSVGDARLRFSAPFFLVAIFFVIFDLEVVFLFAWVIGFEESGMAGFIEALIFIVILLAGLVYLWKLGALDWGKHQQTGRLRRQLPTAEQLKTQAAPRNPKPKE